MYFLCERYYKKDQRPQFRGRLMNYASMSRLGFWWCIFESITPKGQRCVHPHAVVFVITNLLVFPRALACASFLPHSFFLNIRTSLWGALRFSSKSFESIQKDPWRWPIGFFANTFIAGTWNWVRKNQSVQCSTSPTDLPRGDYKLGTTVKPWTSTLSLYILASRWTED